MSCSGKCFRMTWKNPPFLSSLLPHPSPLPQGEREQSRLDFQLNNEYSYPPPHPSPLPQGEREQSRLDFQSNNEYSCPPPYPNFNPLPKGRGNKEGSVKCRRVFIRYLHNKKACDIITSFFIYKITD